MGKSDFCINTNLKRQTSQEDHLIFILFQPLGHKSYQPVERRYPEDYGGTEVLFEWTELIKIKAQSHCVI